MYRYLKNIRWDINNLWDNLIFSYVIQKSDAAARTVLTNIHEHAPASSDNENLSADPDEAIRRRLAELRNDDSPTGKE